MEDKFPEHSIVTTSWDEDYDLDFDMDMDADSGFDDGIDEGEDYSVSDYYGALELGYILDEALKMDPKNV